MCITIANGWRVVGGGEGYYRAVKGRTLLYVYIVVVDIWFWWWWWWRRRWRNVEGMRNDGRRNAVGRDDRYSRKGGGGVVKFKTPISVHYARARRNHIYVLTPAVGEVAASSAAGRRVRSTGSGGQASARRHGVTAETQRRTRARPATRRSNPRRDDGRRRRHRLRRPRMPPPRPRTMHTHSAAGRADRRAIRAIHRSVIGFTLD